MDVGTLGGTRSVAYAINERGQVGGRNLTVEPPSIYAFVWTASKGMVDLAPLSGYASSEPFLATGLFNRAYDVSPDGKRFLMLRPAGGSEPNGPPPQIVVVQHWVEELKTLVPRGR